MNFVAIDFETANNGRNSACEIGLCRVEGGRVAETRSWLINPPGGFLPWNTKIHGIRAADVVDAPTFGVLWPEVAKWMDGQVLIAHNASFDMSVLRACLDEASIAYPHLSYMCSVRLARQTWHTEKYGLGALCALHEIELEHHHAGADAEGCARITIKSARHHLAADAEELAQATGTRLGRLFPGGYLASGAADGSDERRKQAAAGRRRYYAGTKR